ncbi:MAG: amidohydrolase [Pseudomonadales bacterium]
MIKPLALILALLGCVNLARGAEADYLLALYKYLHANPELSFQEDNTAKRITKELQDAGFEVTEKVGGHGIVALMENGDGPTVMLRTDLDALPVEEQTGLPYASEVTATEQTGQQVSVMHACGHDIHMTAFVGAARTLAQQRDRWQGTLMMIGQPAEERGAGARLMLDDGLFTRFPRPDYNLALHANANMPAGQVSLVSGWALANVDSVDISIFGVGGHGAYPHTTKDPVVIAASIIMNLQTLVSREINPIEPAVVTVGSIHGGAKHNIISDRVDLQLTVRSFSDEVREQLLAGIERVAKLQAKSFGLPEDKLPEVAVKNEFTPSLWNDPDLTSKIRGVLEQDLGADNVLDLDPVMGGEDFSRYGRQEPPIPSLLMWLGAVKAATFAAAKKDKRDLPSLHSPFFAPEPEKTIDTGVKALTQAALSLFKSH